MQEKKFTSELKDIFEYLHDTILKQYPCEKISVEYFILSCLDKPSSVAYNIMSKVMLQDTLVKLKSELMDMIEPNITKESTNVVYNDFFDHCVKKSRKTAYYQNAKEINSGHLFYNIISENEKLRAIFKKHGVTLTMLNRQLIDETNYLSELNSNNVLLNDSKPKKHTKKPKKENDDVITVHRSEDVEDIETENNDDKRILTTSMELQQFGKECEKSFTNLNEKARRGEIEIIYENESIYENIFNTLSKKNKNNVVIVGKSGVGKTDTVKHLANLIVNHQVPSAFDKKVLLEIDFNLLLSGTSIRGSFEAKLKAIINDAKRNGNYIFFVDNVTAALNSKVNDSSVENFIETVMKERSIMLICTASEKGYTKEIGDYPEWNRHFEKITIDEPSNEKCINILKHHADRLQSFHNVRYDDNIYELCANMSKRYISDKNLPDSAIDILDKAGAKASLVDVENDNIKEARKRLSEVIEEYDRVKYSSKKNYDKLDELEKQQIELNTILNLAIKNYNLEKKPYFVTASDIKECISEKTNIPITELTSDDKESLRGLEDRIKKTVIGQDEAVSTVCKAIKRQRIGVANKNKPIVLFFGGSTGVGKTYLSKTIAKEIFGSEEKMIRLDMSEFSESTSVTKIFGAPPSYVGYGDGGSLVDKLKSNKHCILLLDEIEKACDKVYNVFLQMFDEGRLTDSKGNTVDCKNLIIIMTSNIGSRESEERGSGIGFVKDSEDFSRGIIENTMKRKFSPEFINRIDKIVFFNKLNDERIKDIIAIELEKLEQRVNEIGYKIDFNGNDTVDYLFAKLDDKNNLGARPIMRLLQNEVEDAITDYIIDNDVKFGETLIFNELKTL